MFVRSADDQSVDLIAPGVAKYRVYKSGLIDLEIVDGAPETAVRAFLLGPAFGLVCYFRGDLVMHSAAFRIRDSTVLLVGPSGMGKSTLISHLAARGHPVLCDDVCVVRPRGNDGYLAWPGTQTV